MHDIGKIGIPDGILNKKPALNDEDLRHVMNHPVLAKHILSVVSEFQNLLDIIFYHHERTNGKGYPVGLTREEIPLLSGSIAVADAYDAMRSGRPYRNAMTEEEAILELERVKGVQLDEEIVDRFIQIITT